MNNNNNNRHPGGNNNNQGYNNHDRRMSDGPPGRGFHQPGSHNNNNNNHQGRGFHSDRGPMMGRGGGGPPPPPPRDRGGDRFGPPRGRGGFFPGNNNNNRDNRFMGGRGPPSMGRGPPQSGRGDFMHGRGNNVPPPPPPMPRNNNHMTRGLPPPPPPPRYQGVQRGIPPPPTSPLMQAQQLPSAGVMFGQAGLNHYPQHNNPPPHSSGQPMVQQQPSSLHQQHQPRDPNRAPPHLPQALMQQHPSNQPVGDQQQPSAAAENAWTEHTAPNSIRYYYNGLTKESTYIKPIALTQKAEVATVRKASTRTWAEYAEAGTGKMYYSDGVQTTWEKPDGFQEPKSVRSTEVDDGEPPKKRKKTAARKEADFSSKSEAIAAFKGLLLAKDIQPTTKWNEVVRVCSSDSRWDACLILTQGERKQALAEYQTKRANVLRDREREERMRAKDAFAKLLSEVLPSIESFNPMTSRFMDVRDSLSKNDRFYAVEDEPTRETLFLEFCEEVRKRDDRKQRSMKRDAKDALFAFLKEREDSGQLTFASTWSSFNTALDEKDKSDSRFQVSGAMSVSDRELYFSDFVLELHAAEDEKRRRIRDARRKAEQAQRDVYREMLSKLAADQTILPSTRWRNVEDLISNEAPCDLLKEQDRDAPRELFQDFVDEWHDVYRRDRAFLARLVQPSSGKGINLNSKATYEEFCQALRDESADSPEQYSDIRQILNHKDPISSARLYFNELVCGVKETTNATLRRNSRRASAKEDSSDDEGEIIEDGEIEDDGK